jgi:hypothetical protein
VSRGRAVVYTKVSQTDTYGIVRGHKLVRVGMAFQSDTADMSGEKYLIVKLDALPMDGRLEIHFEEDSS